MALRGRLRQEAESGLLPEALELMQTWASG